MTGSNHPRRALLALAGLALALPACAAAQTRVVPQSAPGDTPMVWHDPARPEHPAPVNPSVAGIIGLDHTHLLTADIDKAVDFYVNVLGFAIALEIHDRPTSKSLDQLLGLEGASYRHALVTIPGGPTYDDHLPWIEIWEIRKVPLDTSLNADPTRNLQGKGYNAYRVMDLAALLDRLKARGIRFVNGPQMRDGKPTSIYVVDPDGQIIELNQYQPPAK